MGLDTRDVDFLAEKDAFFECFDLELAKPALATFVNNPIK